MAWPKSGHNAYIYISGVALVGGNSWDIALPSETVEFRQFGDTFVTRDKTFNDASGTIDSLQDSELLTNAALATGSLPVYIYPDRGTTGEYWSGNAIFGVSASGSVDAAVAQAGDWVGDGAWGWTEA